MKRPTCAFLPGAVAAAAPTHLASTGAFAQATGRLTGQVLDPTGATVEGATVSLFLADGMEPALTPAFPRKIEPSGPPDRSLRRCERFQGLR